MPLLKPARRPFTDRRQVERRVINRVAQYQSDGVLPRACMVTDISETGARLYADTEMPDVFVLEISGDHGVTRRDCQVVWRLGGECGVQFAGRARR